MLTVGQFWMCKYHFRSHLWPFQIITELLLFLAAILDVQNSLSIAFLDISDRYGTFYIFLKNLTKWTPAAILDVRKSLSIAFLVISDRYGTFFPFFDKMAAGGHFLWNDNVNYQTRPRYLDE